MSVEALLFIKPVSNDKATLAKIIEAVPSVGYAAEQTIWPIAKSYGIDNHEYPLCIPLTFNRKKGRDWSMPGIDDVHNYAHLLQQRIPEINQIAIKHTYGKKPAEAPKQQFPEDVKVDD